MSKYQHQNGFTYTQEEVELSAKMKNDTVENVLAANFIGEAQNDPMLVDPYANESQDFLDMKQELPFASDANLRSMVYGGEQQQQKSGPDGVGDFIADKLAGFSVGLTSILDNAYKGYESGQQGLLAEIIVEGPFQAAYGYAAAEFRKKGYDVPDEVLWLDLTSPAERRAVYEDHMLTMAKNGMDIETAKKLDPTNKVKFEAAIDWFNKHTYSYYDKDGVAEDYVTLAAKGDMLKAADAFTSDVFQAIPSVIISRANIYGIPVGAMLLGSGAYMDNFERELFNRGNNPGVSRNDIVKNSLITGGSDMVMEIIGGRVLNKLAKGGIGKESRKDLLINLPKIMRNRMGLGYLSEFATEGGTGVLQDYADAFTFGDQKTYTDYLRTFFKDGFLGGFMGAGMVATSRPKKKDIYGYVSSNNYKQDQLGLEADIVRLTKEIQGADPATKLILEAELNQVKAKKQKNEDNMINFFDNMTNKAKADWAGEIDLQNEQLNIIGNDKYSTKSQENAREKLKKSTEKLSKFFKGTDLKYDASLESLTKRVFWF